MKLIFEINDKDYKMLNKYFSISGESIESIIKRKISEGLKSIEVIKYENEKNKIAMKIIEDIKAKKLENLSVVKIQKRYNIGFPLSGKIYFYHKLFIEGKMK